MMVRCLLLLGLWVLSLVSISFYGGPLSYGFFFAVTLIPILSYVYLGIVAFTFKIYQNLESRNMVCDQMTDYYFVLQNDMPFAFLGVRILLFPDFFTVEEMPGNTEYELLPGDEYTFRTRLSCKYRGEYEVGVKSVVLTDFLHIFRMKYHLPGAIRAIVAPKVVLLEGLKCLERLDTPKAGNTFMGSEYPQGAVRDYIPRDSMRLIHWKATARTGKLKVRQFEGENKQGIALYFTGKRYSEKQAVYLPLENKIVETVLAVTSYFTRQNIPVVVSRNAVGAIKQTNVSGVDGFDRFYGEISEFIFDSHFEETEGVNEYIDRIFQNPCRVAFFILHQVWEELLIRTKELADMGVYVVIYLVSDEVSESFEGLCNERRQIFVLGTEADLAEEL